MLRLIAAFGLSFAATGALAQTAQAQAQADTAPPAQTESALEDLIPDAAVADPESWARSMPVGSDTSVVPVAEALAEGTLDPASPLDPLPDMQLAWPDEQSLPAIERLEPEADVALAEQQTADPDNAAGAGAESATPRFEQASVERVTDHIELAFPAGAEMPLRDEVIDRFASLSTLKSLRDSDDNLGQIARRARADQITLLRTLRTYGYYDAEVYQSLGGSSGESGTAEDAADIRVRFDVVPGPQYHYGSVDLGALSSVGADFARLRAAFDIQPGEPVLADAVLLERARLEIALGESGYAFATLGETDLLIDHDRREGDLTVPVDPGGKYRFGQVISTLPDFLSSRHLGTIARFEPGDLYAESLVDDLRRGVLATGLVSTVTVTPRDVTAPAGTEPGVVDLDVALTEGPLRTIAGLAGYSSGEGLRVEASWEHRNVFPPEGAIRVRGILGTREQLAGVTFRRSNFTGRDRVLSLDLFAQTEDRPAYNARNISFLAGFERVSTLIYQKHWTYRAGFELVATQEREADVAGVFAPRQTYFIAALPGQVQYDGSNDLLDPSKGFRIGARISPEFSKINGGATASYIRAQFDLSGYQPLTEQVILAARLRLGTITGAGIAEIAPSRRFYAGGGGSVRGYGYQEIGPRNTAGDPSGGRSLTELALEARIRTGWFGGALSFVPFVDAGAVDETQSPRLNDLRFGAGVGIRYHTNFGPLRIDVGTPLNPQPGDSRIAVYVALGQAF